MVSIPVDYQLFLKGMINNDEKVIGSLLISALIALLLSTVSAESIVTFTNGIIFGDSYEEIQLKAPNGKFEEFSSIPQWSFYTITDITIAGIEGSSACYYINTSNELSRVQYDFRSQEEDFEKYCASIYDDYENVKKVLTMKYGSPLRNPDGITHPLSCIKISPEYSEQEFDTWIVKYEDGYIVIDQELYAYNGGSPSHTILYSYYTEDEFLYATMGNEL